MARAIDEFFAAWDAFSGQDPGGESGWRGISVEPAGTCKLIAARRFPGNEEALLACFPSLNVSASEYLPEGNGFEVVRADPHQDGKAWIAISRKPSGSPELFADMVVDVVGIMDIEASQGEATVFKAMIRRIKMWQQFMGKGARILGPEAELGLVGELAFFEALIDAGVDTDMTLESWVGPDDAPQDFVFSDGAVEVKATLAPTGFSAKIGSLEQLDDAILAPLFLAGVRFSKGEKLGMTLPEIVNSLEQKLSFIPGAAEFIKGRVFAAGYHESHSERYVRRFILEEIRLFSVHGDFPRLTRGNIPEGIVKSVYEIDLSGASAYESCLESVLNKIGVVK